jgi:hypothetical protein
LTELKTPGQAARAEGTYADNTIEIDAAGANALDVHLHESMVDLSQPVIININGQTHHNAQVTCSVSDLLTQARLFQDPGRIFYRTLSFDGIADKVDDIAEAVDQPELGFDTNRWHLENPGPNDYAGADEDLADYEASSIQTQIELDEPSKITFKMKVSSETNYDFLTFSLNGVEREKISGESGWVTKTYNVEAGDYELKWQYAKDRSVSRGDDKGYVDQLTIEPWVVTNEIPEAVDQPDLPFDNVRWHLEDPGPNDFAATDEDLSDNEESVIQTNFQVDEPSIITFKMKVSSERNYDFLTFDLDGDEKVRLSGESGWVTKTYSVTAGSHLLRWQYRKDRSVSSGADKGYVDELTVEPGSVTDEIAEAVDQTALVFQNDRWHLENPGQSDYAAADDDLTHNEESSIQTIFQVEVASTITFRMKVSSERNYDFLTFDLDGEEMVRLSGESGWVTKSYNVAPGSHLLRWQYRKDRSVSNGDDKGYVDQLQIH